MALSENAEKGRKTAMAVSVLLYIASAVSLLTFNILLAATGFWAARSIKRGSAAARTVGLVLRLADIPFVIMISLIVNSLGGVPAWVYVAVITATAALDAIILPILFFGENLKAFVTESSAEE